MKAKVHVELKESVLDPQGQAIVLAAATSGICNLVSARVSKVFDLDLGNVDSNEAKIKAEELSKRLLANDVIERYFIEIV